MDLCAVLDQAREDFIGLLKSEKTGPEMLEAHYGLAVHTKPLQALQRDAQLVHSSSCTEDVYEKPMAEVSQHEQFNLIQFIYIVYNKLPRLDFAYTLGEPDGKSYFPMMIISFLFSV